VRHRVVEAAAELIGRLPAEQVPAPLRRVARFEPRRRARLGAAAIAARLAADADFRAGVAEAMAAAEPELAAAVAAGPVPSAADPVLVAALAYLLRPQGWTERVEAARAQLDQARVAAKEAHAAEAADDLRTRLAAVRTAHAEELDGFRADLGSARAEIRDLRGKLHAARVSARAAEERADELARSAEEDRAAAKTAASAADAELRRLRTRLTHLESAAEDARRAARAGRSADEARLRILLDALTDTAKGLRAELDLPAIVARPADSVAGGEPTGHRAVTGRGLAEDDPALLDRLLTLPQVHLIVDGYNVTKSGYGDLPLVDQRRRLLSGLAGLHAQTRAEITCVFDGARLDGPVAVTTPRGVRVMFSEPGQTADELVGRLVRAEPRGRAIVVISSDREVAESVRRAGARPAPSALLLRRLGRS
jgi:predicted RNA-binding protein with PIN domain